MNETRKLILGDEELPVLRWLREDASGEAGTLLGGPVARLKEALADDSSD